MQQVLTAIDTLATAGEIPLATIHTVEADSLTEQVSSIAAGVASLAELYKTGAEATGASGVMTAATIGEYASVLSTVDTVAHCLEDDGMLLFAWATGDKGTANEIIQDMASIDTKEEIDALVTLATSPLGGLVSETNTAVQALSTVYGYVSEGIEYYDLSNPDSADASSPAASDNQAFEDVLKTDAPVYAASDDDFVQLDGNIVVQSNLGPAGPLYGLDVIPGPDGQDLSAISDPNGNYSMYIPVGSQGFDYSQVNVSIIDPLSSTNLGGEIVDISASLSGLVQLPTIDASVPCIDDDAGTPDADDPDCD